MAQEQAWGGEFGDAYHERNRYSPHAMDVLWRERYGRTRTSMNEEFVVGLVPTCARILEVGCGIGTQLALLRDLGYTSLYGIDINLPALAYGRLTNFDLNLMYGSAVDIPFKDNYFDLVFTSGLLIHIDPGFLPQVCSEICRCARHFVWGFEYYADRLIPVEYRGYTDMLWKMDYCQAYLNQFPGLEAVRRVRLSESKDEVGEMFLLERGGPA